MQEKSKRKIPAGNFLSWVDQFQNSQNSNKSVEVPCGECRACCTSSYFIHIKPNEKETLSKIPKGLLFEAPGLPKGNVLMGYDENGNCPMFKNNSCLIYDYRPQTCRKFDCRVFPATGISEHPDKPKIVEQSNRWKFDSESEQEIQVKSAIRKCAGFIMENKEHFPEGFIPSNPLQQASLVLKVYEIFLPGLTKKNNLKSKHQKQKLVNSIVNASEKLNNFKNENVGCDRNSGS